MNIAFLYQVFALVGISPLDSFALEKDRQRIVLGLFQLADLSLDDVSSCRGVSLFGTEKTVGDFVASLLSQVANISSKHPVVYLYNENIGKRSTRSHFEVRKSSGNEEWKWGVSFIIDADTGVVDRTSVQCIVAG